MLRVSAENVLIVPPFESAWICLSDYGLRNGCCVEFEAKGENDVTVILRPSLGSRRWQHLQLGANHLAVEDNYTIILGSHRNSRLKIEKNGDSVTEVHGLACPKVSSAVFTRFWISYSEGTITVGSGPPGTSPACQWTDPAAPPPDIQHVGLSCWDKHVSYRQVALTPPLAPAPLAQQLKQQQQAQQQQQQLPGSQQLCAEDASTVQTLSGDAAPGGVVPSLLQLAMEAVAQWLKAANVCDVLQLAELLLPTTEALYASCLQLLGRHAGQLLQEAPGALRGLSWDALGDLLSLPLLGLTERQVFDLVALWCGCGLPSGPTPPASPTLLSHHRQQQQGQQLMHLPLAEQCGLQQQQRQHQAVALDGPGMVHFEARHSTMPPGIAPGALDQQAAAAAAPSIEPWHCYWPAPEALTGASSPAGNHGPFGQDYGSSRASSPGGDTVTSVTSVTSAWFRQAPSEEDVVQLVSMIRFVLMSPAEVASVLQHPLVQQYPVLRGLIQQQAPHLGEALQSNQTVAGIDPSQPPLYNSTAPEVAAPFDPSVGQYSSGGGGTASGTYRLLNRRVLQHEGVAAVAPSPDAGPSLGDAAAVAGAAATAPAPAPAAGSCAPSAAAGSGSSLMARPGRISQRRFNPRCTELMYVFPGDKNGVVWHLATEYGRQQWVNPVLSKRVEVKASSPASRYTDPKALVSGQFLHSCWAGPRYSGGRPSTWWSLDLGPGHRLAPNYYVLRQDGSSDFPRHWVLQGSVDGSHWVDLRRHMGDATLQLPGQYASWPVTGPAAAVPFRAFRVLLTGPTVSATAPWNLCLCSLEFYGHLYKLEEP